MLAEVQNIITLEPVKSYFSFVQHIVTLRSTYHNSKVKMNNRNTNEVSQAQIQQQQQLDIHSNSNAVSSLQNTRASHLRQTCAQHSSVSNTSSSSTESAGGGCAGLGSHSKNNTPRPALNNIVTAPGPGMNNMNHSGLNIVRSPTGGGGPWGDSASFLGRASLGRATGDAATSAAAGILTNQSDGATNHTTLYNFHDNIVSSG